MPSFFIRHRHPHLRHVLRMCTPTATVSVNAAQPPCPPSSTPRPSSSTVTRTLSTTSPPSPRPRYAGPSFAFDIDGVIWKARVPIPSAKEAFRALYDTSVRSWRVPLVFLTNSGGMTEQSRADELSSALDLPVTADMVVLSHTPLRSLVSKSPTDQQYQHQHQRAKDQQLQQYNYDFSSTSVLTVGGPRCAHILRTSYGFPHALDTTHLSAINAYATPLARTDDILVSDAERHAASLPISAIFVMSDSRNWGRDVQLLLDLTLPDNGKQYATVPHLYYTNSDILFPSKHKYPRLAGGALRVAFHAVWAAVTNGKLQLPAHTHIGKPHAPNYICAEQSLRTQLERLGFDQTQPPHRIYAVGDNPSSDVRGANQRGGPWRSVLVRTGNFSPTDSLNGLPETDQPSVIVDNVLDAVQHALADTNSNPL